jgi:hypothetical protein
LWLRGDKIKDLKLLKLKGSSYAICEIGTLICIDVPEFSLDCTTSSPFILFILALIWFSPKPSIVLYSLVSKPVPLSQTWISNWSFTCCKLRVVFSAHCV